MAINFPNSLDQLSNPNATDSLSNPSHSEQHRNANDAIEALQSKVGADNSSVTTSFDYRIRQLESESGQEIADKLGLSGNNTLEVTGIENKTAIDSFSKTEYRTVRWVVQLSKGSEIVTEALDLIQDGTDFHLQEYEVSSNTNNVLADITLEENSGIISLCVTPTNTTVTARYYRTALKV